MFHQSHKRLFVNILKAKFKLEGTHRAHTLAKPERIVYI